MASITEHYGHSLVCTKHFDATRGDWRTEHLLFGKPITFECDAERSWKTIQKLSRDPERMSRLALVAGDMVMATHNSDQVQRFECIDDVLIAHCQSGMLIAQPLLRT